MGDIAREEQTLRAAIDLARAYGDSRSADRATLMLARSYLPLGRYAVAVELAQQVRLTGDPASALDAEFTWGTALCRQGLDLAEFEAHLREAERLLTDSRENDSLASLAAVRYQLAGVFTQQGKIEQAIAFYQEALAIANADEAELDLQRHILAYNNLAHNLRLLGDVAAAADYARAGLHLAQEKVSLTHQPYLYSTLGEIALAQDDLETAERYFTEGLALAERLSSSERIAGLTANLGLVARARGDVAVATSRFLRALADAESLQLNQMAVEIRLWLVPLVTRREAQHYLREARVIAERGGYQRELQTIAQLELQVQPFDF